MGHDTPQPLAGLKKISANQLGDTQNWDKRLDNEPVSGDGSC
jgi:hypothetical protein